METLLICGSKDNGKGRWPTPWYTRMLFSSGLMATAWWQQRDGSASGDQLNFWSPGGLLNVSPSGRDTHIQCMRCCVIYGPKFMCLTLHEYKRTSNYYVLLQSGRTSSPSSNYSFASVCWLLLTSPYVETCNESFTIKHDCNDAIYFQRTQPWIPNPIVCSVCSALVESLGAAYTAIYTTAQPTVSRSTSVSRQQMPAGARC